MNKQGAYGHFDKWRLIAFYILMAVILGVYAFRLFDLQILQGSDYLAQADENRLSIKNDQASRGNIYDRNGLLLAGNIPSYNVSITPANLPIDEGSVQKLFRALSLVVGVPVSKGELTEENARAFKPCETDFGITQIVKLGDTNAPYTAIEIKCNVSAEIAMIVKGKENEWPGVTVEIEPIRDYPTGYLTAEVVGFLGPIPAIYEKDFIERGFIPGRDKVGYAGVESTMQDVLAGKNGERLVEVDVAGQEIRNIEEPVDPLDGNNIKLTIDTRLQLAARTALVNEIEFWNRWTGTTFSSNGVVIAEDLRTGEILAMVSYPNYENNRMARIIPGYYYQQLSLDPDRPLFNHAISAEHPPGSVFKMAAAIGALNEGVVTLEKEIYDPGKITIMQKFYANDPGTPRDYVCWNRTGHGIVDFLHGIALSCDVYFYKIGGGYEGEVENGGLGILRIGEYARALGYGRILGIELPGEAEGLLPNPTWKRINVGENWSTGDTYIGTMGQGYVLATPLQVLVSIATLANDGKLMRPTIIREILDNQGNVVQPFKADMLWDITVDPVINIFEDGIPTGEKITVQPWVIEKVQEGMRMVVTEGTAKKEFEGVTIPTAGKTGTAEYCDDIAQAQNRCQPGSWPAHAWYVGYAPYEDPEIAVIAFVYGGTEGSQVAGPIVREVIKAYFNLKATGTK
ncbi:MAG: penicillin-binding protein 2 [Anaerolinea sp.]|nr:penicillin-binding protein 2 [Anaerolinea sp.]